MRKFLLTIRFCGTDFVGWQVQPNGLSVQTCVQDALERIFGVRPALTGCSRTDSGVHALGYRACFEADTEMDCSRIAGALTAVLPESVSVPVCETVPADFHPRYDAKAKEYIYRLYDGARDPFLKDRAWHCKARLDERAMQDAAQVFLGRHDFRAFMADGSSVTHTERTIYAFTVARKGHIIELTVCGDGFLYNMVRILTGTLVRVGLGRLSVDDCRRILENRDRGQAGATAPAAGLYLNRVFYKEGEYGPIGK